MTRYCLAFLLALFATLFAGFWGCDGLPFEQSTVDVEVNDDTSREADVMKQSDAAVQNAVVEENTEKTVTTVVSQASSNADRQNIDAKKPTKALALELAIRELQLELDLKETNDSDKRGDLQRRIESIRQQRQTLYLEDEKGNQK